MVNQSDKGIDRAVVDVEQFWRDGYIQIKNVFPQEFIAELRKSAEVAKTDKSIQGDLLGLNSELLKKLVSHPAVVAVAREILQDTPVYFGDSSITYGSFHRGWHKDNRLPDRFKHHYADWRGKYTMLRFGIYLQDHTSHSGGLGVRTRSHEASTLVNLLEKLKLPFVSSLVNGRVKTRLQVIASQLKGSAKHLDSSVGDLLVWNQRLTHSGNALRLKFAPNLKLPTWVENKIPDSLVKPYEKDRISIFLAFAKEDDHLKRGLEFLKTRDYMAKKWELYKDVAIDSKVEEDSGLKILGYDQIYHKKK